MERLRFRNPSKFLEKLRGIGNRARSVLRLDRGRSNLPDVIIMLSGDLFLGSPDLRQNRIASLTIDATGDCPPNPDQIPVPDGLMDELVLRRSRYNSEPTTLHDWEDLKTKICRDRGEAR